MKFKAAVNAIKVLLRILLMKKYNCSPNLETNAFDGNTDLQT